jgi:hypothetical protein
MPAPAGHRRGGIPRLRNAPERSRNPKLDVRHRVGRFVKTFGLPELSGISVKRLCNRRRSVKTLFRL